MSIESLKLQKDFKKLLDFGTKEVTNSFVLFSSFNQINNLRFGIIASKKVFPLAVQRNRAKRRLRSALRTLVAKVGQANVDIVIILRRPFLTENFAKLVSQLTDVFQQAKL
jgi:ribonuclease P protein component